MSMTVFSAVSQSDTFLACSFLVLARLVLSEERSQGAVEEAI